MVVVLWCGHGTGVCVQMTLSVVGDLVRWDTPPRTMDEHKRLICAYVRVGDEYGITKERKWLVGHHGAFINAVIDNWIAQIDK